MADEFVSPFDDDGNRLSDAERRKRVGDVAAARRPVERQPEGVETFDALMGVGSILGGPLGMSANIGSKLGRL